MSQAQINALNLIEQTWNRTGQFKAPKDFDLAEALENESFVRGLANRGVILPKHWALDDSTLPVGSLSRIQSAAVLTMINFDDKRSRTKKLAELGVELATWNGWMKDENFKNYYLELAEKNFRDALPVAQESLIKAMERGSVEGIKYFMEVTGRHTQGSAEVQNLKVAIAKLVESINMHVKDPAVLDAIAQDFDAILKGGSPTPMKELVL